MGAAAASSGPTSVCALPEMPPEVVKKVRNVLRWDFLRKPLTQGIGQKKPSKRSFDGGEISCYSPYPARLACDDIFKNACERPGSGIVHANVIASYKFLGGVINNSVILLFIHL